MKKKLRTFQTKFFLLPQKWGAWGTWLNTVISLPIKVQCFIYILHICPILQCATQLTIKHLNYVIL